MVHNFGSFFLNPLTPDNNVVCVISVFFSGWAFRDEGCSLWKTSTKSEKAAKWLALAGWKDYRSQQPEGGQSAGFKYRSPGRLKRKWRQSSPLWSIAECLPGICLFNPLSKAAWAGEHGWELQAHKKILKDGSRMHVDQAHPLTLPHRPGSRVGTHAEILLMKSCHWKADLCRIFTLKQLLLTATVMNIWGNLQQNAACGAQSASFKALN